MITQLKLFIQLKAKEQFQKYFFLKVLTQSDDISWGLSQILHSLTVSGIVVNILCKLL